MLNRLMLRLGVVNALSPQKGETAPTIAGANVFDSRIDDIEFDGELTELPIVIVYAEEDELILEDRGAGYGAFLRHVNVRIEIALGSFSASVIDGQKHVTYGLPTTDSELEALLDMFEAQIWRTLWHPIRPASLAVQQIITQVDGWSSLVSRSSSDNNRLAARTITMRCRIPQDCRWGTSTVPLLPAPVNPDGTPTLPQFTDAPYLNGLVTALAKNPANAGLMSMLREVGGGGPQLYVPPFLRMGTNVSVMAPTDPVLAAQIRARMANLPPVTVQSEWVLVPKALPDPVEYGATDAALR